MSEAPRHQVGQKSFHCSNPNCRVAYNIIEFHRENNCKNCGAEGQICETSFLKCYGRCGSSSWASIPINQKNKTFKCHKCGGEERVVAEAGDIKKLNNSRSETYSTGSNRTSSRPVKPVTRSTASSPRLKKSYTRRNNDFNENSSNTSASNSGNCEDCLKPIGYRRLQVQPNTRYCVSCAPNHPDGQKNRSVQETWGSRDAWKRDRGGWRKGGK
jgi:RNA polymerase-binding transcription factor DksA